MKGTVPRHKTAPSVDTNASAIAESTISFGQIGKFPEPPSSIPNSPITSTFSAATVRQLPISPISPRLQPPAPLHPRKLPTSFVSHVDPSHSFVQPTNNPQKASTILSANDWHDGASSIDVDSAKEQLLPDALSTSFITALLRENKFKRASSSTSVALSGISEITHPRHSPGSYRAQHSSSLAPASQTPALTYDFDSTATVAAPGRRLISDSKSFGSSKTFQSSDGLLEKRLSTTYESDTSAAIKELDFLSSPLQPHFLSQDPTASRQPFSGSRSQRGSSASNRSSKSFLSRMSQRFSLHHVLVRKPKPLPPIPILPDISLAQQQTYHELEMSSALPDLINRASALRRMLENGQRPHSSAGSFEVVSLQETPRDISDAHGCNGKHGTQKLMRSNSSTLWSRKFQRTYSLRAWNRKTKRKCVMIMSLFVFCIIVLIAGLVLGLRKHQQPSCPEGTVGSQCNINSNCICTSTNECNGLAQAVIDLLPSMNSAFNANYTPATAYSSFWLMEGGSQGSNCATQATVLDVGKTLNQVNFPNRTEWAQTALLWNALQTQDLVASLQLQNFIQSLPWNSLGSQDGPINNVDSASFSITVSGYIFNFASQTVTQPSGTFETLGQPSDAQIQRVSQTALDALNRMYTYAQASSTQQQAALQKYWTSVLLQRADTLPIFKAALSVSALMLPFNASSQEIRNLYPSNTSSPFPPPLACFPDLDPAFQEQVDSFETVIFGLPGITSNQTGFNPSCYSDRPIYGVLDVLQMRLPFRDDVSSVTQHSAVMNREANSRVIFSVGKGFSGIFNGTVNLSPSQLDPRQYGTVNFLDHVTLQYLTSIGDINVANAFIAFVLNSSTVVRPVPPDPSSELYQAIEMLPTIEMAVFGDVTPADFTSIVSPFTINSGALFFGSDDGAALRNWTIGTTNLSIVWTQNATSSLVVRDDSLGNNSVTETWDSISLALNRQMTNLGLVNITNPLMAAESFSP